MRNGSSNTRRLFLRKALTVSSGLVAATYLPKAARAGSCESATGVFRIGQVIPDQHLGDCEMKPLTIYLGPSGEGYFKTQVCTHFTHNKDVWHLRIQILSRLRANSQQIYTWFDRDFDGPEMSEQDVPLFHDWVETFSFNPACLNPPAQQFDPAFIQLIQCC